MGRSVPGLPDGWMKVGIYRNVISFNFIQNGNILTSFFFFFASFLTL